MLHYVENIFAFLKYQFRYFEKVKKEILSPFLTRRDKLSEFFYFVEIGFNFPD